ncbi:AAA family ATPase, partial [bacterium]|nr:AAA family ATPase [bacterium]
MIERKAEKTLKRLASQFPVVAVTGPRQSGKTTLAKMVFPEKKYISFDDKNMRE